MSFHASARRGICQCIQPARLPARSPQANSFFSASKRRYASTTAPSAPVSRTARRTTAETDARRKRTLLAGAGFVGSVTAIVGLIQYYDVKPIQKTKTSEKDIQLDTPTPFLDPTPPEEIPLVETGTSYVPQFPKSIHLPSGDGTNAQTEYHLLGLGIRTVSFLSIQVYVVGLYLPTKSLAALQAALIKQVNPAASTLVPNEREDLRAALLDPLRSEQIWSAILSDPSVKIPMALRIVPVRNTDFAHMRDGFVRGLAARTQKAAAAGNHEFEDESFGAAMKEFKNVFHAPGNKRNLPKGQPLILMRDSSARFSALYQELPDGGKDYNNAKVLTNVPLGVVEDARIARLMWLHYVAGQTPASEEARGKIVEGILELVERPVGTVEAQVV